MHMFKGRVSKTKRPKTQLSNSTILSSVSLVWLKMALVVSSEKYEFVGVANF